MPRISIIVPFYKNDLYLRKCIEECEKLDYPDFEIIVVANVDQFLYGDKIKWLKISDISQATKKDTGVRFATGEICAFIDDDAFPRRDWLSNAVVYFEDSNVGAVCGPGVSPPCETLMERASSAIWASILGSGPARYRYIPRRRTLIDGEAPGYNLLVRRELVLQVGGIGAKVRSGDDAILSEKIRRAGMKIIYAPEVVVYHRRRPLLLPLLRQVFTYGIYRGFFLKKLRSVSRQADPYFALPLIQLIICVLMLLLSPFSSLIQEILSIYLATYLIASFASGLLTSKSLLVSLLTMIGIPMVHFTFALGYAKGLLIKKLYEIEVTRQNGDIQFS